MYIQHAMNYSLKCDVCGTELHKEKEKEPYYNSLESLDALAKSYGWLVTPRNHKCTYCRTFKHK